MANNREASGPERLHHLLLVQIDSSKLREQTSAHEETARYAVQSSLAQRLLSFLAHLHGAVDLEAPRESQELEAQEARPQYKQEANSKDAKDAIPNHTLNSSQQHNYQWQGRSNTSQIRTTWGQCTINTPAFAPEYNKKALRSHDMVKRWSNLGKRT